MEGIRQCWIGGCESAPLVTNWNGNENRLSEATAAVVVIGILQQKQEQAHHQQEQGEGDWLSHQGVLHDYTLVSSSS
jgi:hypothetical protein